MDTIEDIINRMQWTSIEVCGTCGREVYPDEHIEGNICPSCEEGILIEDEVGYCLICNNRVILSDSEDHFQEHWEQGEIK